jgi:transcriptional regulator with XRE-family HTH domain
MPVNPVIAWRKLIVHTRWVSSDYGQMLARNVRGARGRLGIEQEPVARRMRALGFDKWRRQTVAATEKNERRLTAEEVIGLALALETSLFKLVYPDEYEWFNLPSGVPLSPDVLAQLFVFGSPQGLSWDGDTPRFPAQAPGGSWYASHPPPRAPEAIDLGLSSEEVRVLDKVLKKMNDEVRNRPGNAANFIAPEIVSNENVDE